jgi:hypothetical protein
VDINDSGVVFEKSQYVARVSELAPRGHFISKVSAYDPDSVDSLRYAIVGHNHYQSAFEIDEKSGKSRLLFLCLFSNSIIRTRTLLGYHIALETTTAFSTENRLTHSHTIWVSLSLCNK